MGRNHDGGGHEALHHIRAMITGRPAARVPGRKAVGRGAEFRQSATAASVGSGVRRLLEGADAARCDGGTWCGVTI